MESRQGFHFHEFSAGGVVVRGDDVVVIVPVKRDGSDRRVLGLPKGHPEAGETPEQAAAREVREEAGVVGDLIGSLGEIEYSYQRDGQKVGKRVAFFLFEYREGDIADHDHEVEEACWMSLAQAAHALTFAQEREVLARALSRLAADR